MEKNKMNPVYQRLLSLCEKNNIKITPLCVEITGSKGNLPTWKTGHIRNDYLIKISEKFNISADYLLCRTDNPEPPATDPVFITIQRYHSKLPVKDREKMNKMMKDLFAEAFPEDDNNDAQKLQKQKS